jgi:hypothetical protein
MTAQILSFSKPGAGRPGRAAAKSKSPAPKSEDFIIAQDALYRAFAQQRLIKAAEGEAMRLVAAALDSMIQSAGEDREAFALVREGLSRLTPQEVVLAMRAGLQAEMLGLRGAKP